MGIGFTYGHMMVGKKRLKSFVVFVNLVLYQKAKMFVLYMVLFTLILKCFFSFVRKTEKHEWLLWLFTV